MAHRCREAFDLFDTDGSGTIDAKELKVAMRCALCRAAACTVLLQEGLWGCDLNIYWQLEVCTHCRPQGSLASS